MQIPQKFNGFLFFFFVNVERRIKTYIHLISLYTRNTLQRPCTLLLRFFVFYTSKTWKSENMIKIERLRVKLVGHRNVYFDVKFIRSSITNWSFSSFFFFCFIFTFIFSWYTGASLEKFFEIRNGCRFI